MKVLANSIRRNSNKCLIQKRCGLICYNQYQCSTAQQHQSFPEISITNPLLQSLSETEVFQTIKADKSSRSRHSHIEFEEWQRQNRKIATVDNSNQYAAILNARSVHEIRDQLQIYKQKAIETSSIHRKQKILDILDSITSDDTSNDTVNNTSNDESIGPVITMRYLSEAYSKAIQTLANLKQFDEGLKIFEEIKEDKIGLTPNIFAAAIYLIMTQELSRESLNKCFAIRHDMETNYKMKSSSKIYQQLISNAISLKEFKRASGLIKRILEMEQSEKYHILKENKHLRISIIKFYSTTKQINKGLEFMKYLVTTFGNKAIDDHIYSSMISGIAHIVEAEHDKLMIEAGEKLFQQSFQILGRPPTESVFLSLMNMYSYVPDVNSCLDMVQTMISNESFPNPTSLSCSACLKAVNEKGKHDPFTYEEGWKIVEEILDLMKQHNIKPHTAIYSLLFNLCSGRFCNQPDINRLYKYYDEMKNEECDLNPSAALNMLLCGVDYYVFQIEQNPKEKESLKKDCMAFIDWALLQYKKYNITLTKYHQNTLQYKLDNIL